MPIFTNQAQLSYNGEITNSNITTGEIVEVLTIAKTVTPSSYVSGDRITYVVHLLNAGDVAFTNLTLTDNLGKYDYQPVATIPAVALYPLTYVPGTVRLYQNGVEQASPTATVVNDELVITGIGVPAKGVATLVYIAQTNEYAPVAVDGAITNTVTASGNELTGSVSDTAVINVLNAPRLDIVKNVSPRQVSENGQLTYTFTITNTGNTATSADANLQLLDTFQPILENITVTYNGTVLAATDYTYSETTGVFTTNPGIISVPAATFTQNATTGAITVTPGEAVITVTGTV